MKVSYRRSVDVVRVLADFVYGEFFVCFHFKLASFLQGLLLDERYLYDVTRGRNVITPAKRTARDNQTILFISLSTSSSFNGLDAIANESQISWGQGRG